ncbi:MAG: hypothetical protein ABI613_06685 [Gemmatimonadota bacterium]
MNVCRSGRRVAGSLATGMTVSGLMGVLLLGASLSGCDNTLDPLQVSYIAIVSQVDDPSTIGSDARVQYHIRELSGTIPFDTIIHASPFDTIIVRVEPATYSVTLENFPSYCSLRYGSRQDLYVAPGTNTTIARYFATCASLLTIYTYTDGLLPDPEFVYRLTASGGTEQLGVVAANDTVHFDHLSSDTYRVELDHVSANCVVVSDGGKLQGIAVDSTGGAVANFRVVCSDPAQRPQVLSFHGTYHDGAGAFSLRAEDPDGNIERYAWDLTDCHGYSMLPGGAKLRRGLTSGRTAGIDTITIAAAFEVGLPDAVVQSGCMSVRVMDEYGNTTPVIEQPLNRAVGQPPVATSFNASLQGTALLRTSLATADPDGDYSGVFAEALLRDGILGPTDGEPDLGIYNTAGYVDNVLPDLVLGSRFQYYDIYAVIVFLIDANGNFTRLEDTDVFQ